MINPGRAIAARIRSLRWSDRGLDVFGTALVVVPALLVLLATIATFVTAPSPVRAVAASLVLAVLALALLPVYELGLVIRAPGGHRVSRFLRLLEHRDGGIEIALDDARTFMQQFGGTTDPLKNANAVADDVRTGFAAAIAFLEAGNRPVQLTATTALMPGWLMKRHRWNEVPIPRAFALFFRWQMAAICVWMRIYTSDGGKTRRLPVARWTREVAPRVPRTDAPAIAAKLVHDAKTHAHLHAHR